MDPIVVVGGGIVGTSVAYGLRNGDRPVRVFEKNALASGTTGGSVAQFTHHQEEPDPHDYELRRRSWKWLRPHVEAGRFSFDRVGTLHTYANGGERATVERVAEGLDDFGVDVRWVDSDELEQYGLSGDELDGGLLLPDDGVLDPSEIVHYQVEQVRDAGHAVETGVEVTDVHTADGEVVAVETDTGTYDASAVVNAAGPWAHHIDEMVGVDVPIRHTGGPILVLEADREFDLPLTFFEDGVYLREEGQRHALAGDFVTAYEDASRMDPEAARTPSESFQLEVADVVDRYLPSLSGVEVVNEWFDLRTVTPDGRPIVDETTVDGYVVATGMSGYGVTVAPAVGELAASALDGRGDDLLDATSLARFE